MLPPLNVNALPCCHLPGYRMPLGRCAMYHWRCSECGFMFVWTGHRFEPCLEQEKHTEESHAGPLASPRVLR